MNQAKVGKAVRRIFSAFFVFMFIANSLFQVLPPVRAAAASAPLDDLLARAVAPNAPLADESLLVPPVQGSHPGDDQVTLLPPEMAGLARVPGLQTAESVTYQAGQDSFVSVIGSAPLYYRDSQGAWQAIDPTFQPYQESYLVDHNTLRSRAGKQKAWVSAAVGNTAVVWEPVSLWAGGTTPLATVLPQAAVPATLLPGGLALDYTRGWSDPTLGERIASATGQVEHSLIFNQPPVAQGTPQLLELRATLSLVPANSILWADGQTQNGAFETRAGFEIRTPANQALMRFDPVRAYAVSAPAQAIAGSYRLEPTAKPGIWTVSVRTPWDWWVDPARSYPLVLDPIIKVNQSTGYGDGMAWVIRQDGPPENQFFTYGGVSLGVVNGHGWNSNTEGYVQFNSLPAVIQNAPVKIKKASLDVETGGFWRPGYSFVPGKETDWAQVDIVRSASLYYLGGCPADPRCTNQFSIQDNRLLNTALYNWPARPTGTKVGASQSLTMGGPETNNYSTRKPVVTTWDVTAEMAAWYAAWYNQAEPRPYPAFRLAFDNYFCQGPPFSDGGSVKVLDCFQFTMGPGKIRLRLEYDSVPLALGQNILNGVGVPSYLEGVLEDSGHFFQLAVPAEQHWRAVAVRGNHILAASPLPPSARTALKLWQDGTPPAELSNALTQSAEETAFILVDDFSSSLTGSQTALLQAEVLPSSENDLPSDQQRSYRLNYASATLLSPVTGTLFQDGFYFQSDQLLALREFNLGAGDNLLLTVDVSPNLMVGLAAPTNAGNLGDAVVNNRQVILPTSENGSQRTFEFESSVGGKWALVLVNQARPQELKNETVNYLGSINLLICPAGAIPTAKHACQPLRLPDDLTTPPSRIWNGLTIYSEGDFADTRYGWCSKNEGQGAPIIGPVATGRWIYIAQGSICYSNTADTIFTTTDSAVGLAVPVLNFINADKRGQYLLVYGSGSAYTSGDPSGKVTVAMQGAGLSAQYDLQPDALARRNVTPFERYWKSQTTLLSETLSITRMRLEVTDRVAAQVTIDAALAPTPTTWDVAWNYYPNPAISTKRAAFNSTLTQQTPFSMPVALATTELRIFGAGSAPDGLITTLDSIPQPGGPDVYQFRAGRARLTLPDTLGGTSTDVQVVVQPPGMQRLPDGEKSCKDGGVATSCLDLRRSSIYPDLDYFWNDGAGEEAVQQWDLPDVHITGTAAMVMYSQPGRMDIYSSDHPAAANAPAAAQSFSFDTWGAKVQVTEAACEAGGPVTTVVTGTTSISLPMIGEDGSTGAPGITADFKVCGGELKRTKLSFSIPQPGVAIGSTGLGVYLIDGEVNIGPNSTKIILGVNIESLDGVTLTNCRGELTIDTAGMFALSGSGTIVGVLQGQATIAVSWDPLDLLYEASVTYTGGFISGDMRMHTWLGQGFQHKYPWLPDDSAMHFSGTIKSELTLPTGFLVDALILQIPPFDVKIGLQVSFGEFCANGACSQYEWGISGTVSVFGYDVGVYVNSGGPELILGSSDHQLIDQYGGALQAAAAALPEETLAPQVVVQTQLPGSQQSLLTPTVKTSTSGWVAAPASSLCTGTTTAQHRCTVTVAPGLGRALITISWQNGLLDVTLEKPDGTLITPANADANGVTITHPEGALQVAFALNSSAGGTILAGDWKVNIGNVYTGDQAYLKNNYRLVFAADPPKPVLQWLSLLNLSQPDGNGEINIQWLATRGGSALPATTRVEFFITPATPVLKTYNSGTPITAPMAANLGSTIWKPAGLAQGDYYVGARIDDRQNGNGVQVFWAPGTVVIKDSTPPPWPKMLGTLSQADQGAVLVFWQADTLTPDLAGYLVDYTIPEWDAAGTPLARVRKVLPKVNPGSFYFFESIRLGGMRAGFTPTICVHAYDASGNIGGCESVKPMISEVVESSIAAPGIEAVTADGYKFNIVYGGPRATDLAGYFITYTPVGCMLPNPALQAIEGPSPIQVASSVHAVTLTGLTVGQTYRITVYAYSTKGNVSPGVSRTVLLVNPADADLDGMPDQWESLYGLTSAGADPDQDGLTNLVEFQQLAIPLYADSDHDGFYDGEEVEVGYNACAAGNHPTSHVKPKMILSGAGQLIYKLPVNQIKQGVQTLQITNEGAGSLYWSVSASQPWITLGQTSGVGPASLQVGIHQTGLLPGSYTGKIILQGSASALGLQPAIGRTLVETVEIPIQVTVLPVQQSNLYLPLFNRQIR